MKGIELGEDNRLGARVRVKKEGRLRKGLGLWKGSGA